MTPWIVLATIVGYFILLFIISWAASRKSDTATALSGGRQAPWFIVAIAMLGAPISGVTFISVPGMVVTKGFSYLQMALGFIVGYFVIAYVLIPLFYKRNLVSIYGYLEQRFGGSTHKSGAWFFFISQMLGAAVRFYVVCVTLQLLVFTPLNIPFVVNVIVTIALIFLGVMLCVLAFVSCARLANLYILVNEGMALRIECVLQDGPREELDSYFTSDCIASDGRLYDATYQPYTVTSYNYMLEFSHIRVWPWLSDLSVDVLEQADRIKGTANSNAVDPDSDPPPWTPIRYRLTVSKVNGSWRISNITTLTVDPKIDPLPTPDPERSPLPMATPTESPVPGPRLSIITPTPFL